MKRPKAAMANGRPIEKLGLAVLAAACRGDGPGVSLLLRGLSVEQHRLLSQALAYSYAGLCREVGADMAAVLQGFAEVLANDEVPNV